MPRYFIVFSFIISIIAILCIAYASSELVHQTNQATAGAYAQTSGGIEQSTGLLTEQMSNIISIIQQNNFSEAMAQTQNLIADFPGHPDLPEALYEIARQLEWRLKMEDANDTYQQIVQNHPDSPWASKAELGIARAEVLSTIMLCDYSRSKEALAQLIADFSGHPDFPETLYWIAERYRWSREYNEAKSTYQQIMQNYPDSTWVGEAKFGLSKANALSLINRGKLDQLEEAVDKLIADFNDHPDLAVALFNIAKECEWMVKIKDASSIYQRVIDCCPDSPWAEQAELGRARVTVGGLVEQGDVNDAEPALDEMITDFNDNPDLAETLYWMAQRYQDVNSFEMTKDIYQEILQRWPDSKYSELIQIGTPAADIFSLIRSGEHDEALQALDNLIADFNDHPDLAKMVFTIGTVEYYNKALEYENQGLADQAKINFARAASVWDKITIHLPESKPVVVQHAYYFVAACCRKTGEYEKAIQYWQQLINDCPNFIYACSAQCLIGECYEKWRYSNNIPESEVNPLIEQAYKAVIEKYPDCSLVGHSCLRLAEPLLQKGEWAEAAMYFELFLEKRPEDPRRIDVLYDLGQTYEKMGEADSAAQIYRAFIETANPNNPRIETVKAKIEELKGQVK